MGPQLPSLAHYALFFQRSEVSENHVFQIIVHEAYRAAWGREIIHNFFFQTFFLQEESESREASVGLTETPHGDRVSERGEDGKAAGITWGGGGC